MAAKAAPSGTAAAVERIKAALPRLMTDTLERAGFQLREYVELHIEAHGATEGRSNSPRWGTVSGRGASSFTPHAPENIFRIESGNNRWSLIYGSAVPYVVFLEYGTRWIEAKPALTPGMQEFGAERWPLLLQDVLMGIAREFNK